jgi:putative ABC transport system substrate-binding protein
MRRREFIGLVGAAAASWPLAARAQKQRRIAFVHSGIAADKLIETAGPFWVRRFHQTLRELGDIEGSNLVVERYSADGRSERFAALAAEVAGVSINAGIEIFGKRLQILNEAMPSVAKVAYLMSGAWDASSGSDSREAGRHLGIALTESLLLEVNDAQLRRSFAEMAQQQFDAVIVDEGGSFLAQRALIAELAAKQRLPVIYPYRDYVELGGLMAYAPDLGELAQRIANDVHQILNGAKPGDIPFYQPSKFHLIVNLNAIKALELSLPQSLIAGADEVIE